MIKTYPNVSQFWTYKPEEFLKNPVYSRDYPPAKNLEPCSSDGCSSPTRSATMQYWIIQTLNSLALGGLLFLLPSGFSLIFGLMRIANLTHGAFFMLGAYIGVTHAARSCRTCGWRRCSAGLAVALFGGLFERLGAAQARRQPLGQVLVTLGVSFIIADLCLVVWGGDPIPVPTPPILQQPLRVARLRVPDLSAGAGRHRHRRRDRAVSAAGAHAARRHDPRRRRRHADGARGRHPGVAACSRSCSASARRSPAPAACIGGPILSAYPGLDADMLPLALIVVILGGVGSLLGAFVGSFIIGFIYTFGTALFPDLAYVILFLPMILVIAFRPQGLFGQVARMKWIAAPCSSLAASAAALRRRVLRQPREPDPDRGGVRAQPQSAVGYGGLTSLGHAAYLGVAAYLSALAAAQARPRPLGSPRRSRSSAPR